MLNSYNESFEVVNTNVSPNPGDDDFVESEMLFTEYYVSCDDTLNIAAPYNCSSYKWVVTDPEDNSGDELDIQMYEDYTKVQREFVTYIPDSGLETGITYRLTLTVTDKDGNSYSDTCGLVIYKHYEFDLLDKANN